MNNQYWTPIVSIGSHRFRLQLSPSDALSWIVLKYGSDNRAAQLLVRPLLSNSPEWFVYGLSKCIEHGERVTLANLATWVLQTESLDGDASQAVQEVTLRPKQRRLFLTLLESDAECDSEQPWIQRFQNRISKLICKSTKLDRKEIDSWMQDSSRNLRWLDELHEELSTGSIEQAIDAKKFAPINLEDLVDPSTNPITKPALAIATDSGNSSGLDEAEFQRRLLEEKLASMKQLAYGASHEINNPLANIASRAQTLLLDETDPKRRLRLAKINQQAFRAHEMIADMMLFAHPPAPDFQLCDPVDVVEKVIEEMRSLADEQGVSIDAELDTVEHCEADAVQLAVAIKALMTNGLESLNGPGSITVRLASINDEILQIQVHDDGPGILPDAARHLFDPFYSGREAGRGLGFGLSKVWRIAQLHDGEILAESPQGGGATFCLRIPYRHVA